jgi:hypothetical protein
MPDSAYDDLQHHICVELGFCGSAKDGLPLHVDDLIPSKGVITADQFAELVFLAEGLDSRNDPKQLKAAIKAAFVSLLGSQTVEVTALR